MVIFTLIVGYRTEKLSVLSAVMNASLMKDGYALCLSLTACVCLFKYHIITGVGEGMRSEGSGRRCRCIRAEILRRSRKAKSRRVMSKMEQETENEDKTYVTERMEVRGRMESVCV